MEGRRRVIIGKQRNGPIGKVMLTFLGRTRASRTTHGRTVSTSRRRRAQGEGAQLQRLQGGGRW
jgi:hypothetical protein